MEDKPNTLPQETPENPTIDPPATKDQSNNSPEGTLVGPTIDPPAAETARRARARREALLRRLEEEKMLRQRRKEELDLLLNDHNSNMMTAKFETSIIPIL